MPSEFRLRFVPEELCDRYRREGLWSDDTLGRLIDGSVQRRPELPLRIWSEQRPFTSTLAAVHERGRRLAAGLRARGIGPGDVVAFQLPNWVEAAATFFGLTTLGAVLVPIVHSYGAKELSFILHQSGARALVTADHFGRIDYAATVAGLRPSHGGAGGSAPRRRCCRPRCARRDRLHVGDHCTLECELLDRDRFPTQAAARMAVF